jgi:peroxiredoxin (alkyl hydroperoxide reductase subunit C)
MPKLDEPAPDFTSDSNKGKISLSGFRGKWVILFAYPADFTPICEMDIVGFARNKPEFDDLGVQFIGWSVDTAESHGKWIRELKDRSGVEIDYPLLADVNKELAQRYGILHKTTGVTYRAVFIVDPEGILRFIAIYPLDVGRSIAEIQRVIKVLKRARELNHLEALDRARELPKDNSRSLVDEVKRVDPAEEVKTIIGAAEKAGVTLRAIGGLAIRLHCHGRHSAHMRDYHDIDVFGLMSQHHEIVSVFEKLGYSSNAEFNLTSLGYGRLQFMGRGDIAKVDVFLDKFKMQHTLDFRPRIRLDDVTIPITDLMLTKLQIGNKLEAKDEQDIVAILEDHDLGYRDDKEIINIDYMANLCSRNWGLFKSVTSSLQKIKQIIENNDVSVQCFGMEASELIQKVDAIYRFLISKKKGLSWKARNVLGERMKWYEDVNAGTYEAE